MPPGKDIEGISRVQCNTVVTENYELKPLFRGKFDPFVNNGHLGAIARDEQWHLNVHCLQINSPVNLVQKGE